MPEKEYYLDNERVRSFVDTVDRAAEENEDIRRLLDALQEPFQELLTDDWLPELYRNPPPEDNIHAVRTTSEEPSVSIHLLGTDIGCIQRHAFDTDAEFVELFQSHYTNVRCETTKPPGETNYEHGHDH